METPVEVLKEIIIKNKQAHYEYLKEQESLITKREALISNIKLMSCVIKERREVCEAFVNVYFDERKRLRESAEKSLDKAIENGDSEVADIILKFLEIIYSENPFKTINKLI